MGGYENRTRQAALPLRERRQAQEAAGSSTAYASSLSKAPEQSLKKSCLRILLMRYSRLVSRLSRLNILYMFCLLQHNCRANHTTEWPSRRSSSSMRLPICIFPIHIFSKKSRTRKAQPHYF